MGIVQIFQGQIPLGIALIVGGCLVGSGGETGRDPRHNVKVPTGRTHQHLRVDTFANATTDWVALNT